ncbi:MAG: deoxyguanosinetriphosphate triphosphohydrolase [Candidatus Acidiferrales bacterium]
MLAIPLAPWAMDVRRSRGRRYPEPQHPYRNDYARDRDRVVHSRAFRRLEAKTQVFTTRFSDHFRNRLTHTLEVVQVARTVAGALNLNADLTEALALVHDIGHPPFGHAGERQLDACMREHGGRFDHNLHALRIIEQFEQRYLDFPGLNLTFEVREGIIKHSHDYSAPEYPELAEYLLDERPPLEAQLIDLVDEIAYNTADLDDAFEARLLDFDLLRAEAPLFDASYSDVDRRYPQGRRKLKFNEALKHVLDALATDLIQNTQRQIEAAGCENLGDVRRHQKRLVGFSPQLAAENASLKQFLNARLYSHPAIAEDRDRSIAALDTLFRFFLEHPEKMPSSYAQQANSEPRHRVVCDYIAGMTDHFLFRQCQELLGMPASHRA